MAKEDGIYAMRFASQQMLIDKLQQENQQLQERIEYLERSNNRREDTIIEQRQEISNLEDNWNKLKEYIEYELKTSFKSSSRFYYFSIIFEKMQELEQGSDSK